VRVQETPAKPSLSKCKRVKTAMASSASNPALRGSDKMKTQQDGGGSERRKKGARGQKKDDHQRQQLRMEIRMENSPANVNPHAIVPEHIFSNFKTGSPLRHVDLTHWATHGHMTNLPRGLPLNQSVTYSVGTLPYVMIYIFMYTPVCYARTK